jgi:hypothetical protein
MEYLEDWIDQLSPVAFYTSVGILFLTASIAGWYVVNWIEWLRR